MVHPRHIGAHDKFSPDAKVPYAVKFTLEDLDNEYLITPLDRLFRFAMEKLDVPLLYIGSVLHRRSEMLPLPFTLEFRAYDPEKSKEVQYSRILSKDWITFDRLDIPFDESNPFSFSDELDKLDGKQKLEELANNIKGCEPVGGEVRIKINDLTLLLKDGFDYGKFVLNNALSYRDGHCYNNSERKLTIFPNLPWIANSLPGSKIEHDCHNLSPEEAAQLAEHILIDYLATLK